MKENSAGFYAGCAYRLEGLGFAVITLPHPQSQVNVVSFELLLDPKESYKVNLNVTI